MQHPMMQRLIEEFDLIPVQAESEVTAERLIRVMGRLQSLRVLKSWWEANLPTIRSLAKADRARVRAAKDERKVALR